MPRVTHTCPICGSVHTEVKEYYTRTIKIGTEVNARCNNCKKVGKYLQMSKALIATMMYKLQGTHTYTDIAKDLDVSTTTVICMFTKTFHFGIPEYLTATLAIDELRKLKY